MYLFLFFLLISARTGTPEGQQQELLSRIFLGVAVVILFFIIFNWTFAQIWKYTFLFLLKSFLFVLYKRKEKILKAKELHCEGFFFSLYSFYVNMTVYMPMNILVPKIKFIYFFYVSDIHILRKSKYTCAGIETNIS